MNSKKSLAILASLALGLAATAVASPAATGEVVAQAGTKKFTLEELDKKLMEVNGQAIQAFYDARRAALDELVADHLLAAEAKARGISVDALVEAEITKKIEPVKDEDVSAFFEARKAQMGGATLDQMTPRIRQYLEQTGEGTARATYLDLLRSKSKVQILLEPPRRTVKIAADDPSRGPADAAVQIIEFADYQCPFCSRVGPTMEQIEKTYGKNVRFVYKHFPLPMHQQAQKASEAAECAREQGKFWEYHEKLFANQQALGVDKLKEYATAMGLDKAKFDPCLDGGKFANSVQADMKDGQAAGVTGTPAFFINGRFLNGAQPFEGFKVIIDEELTRKGIPVPKPPATAEGGKG